MAPIISSNVVVFARFKDDTNDVFNAEYDYGTYKNSNFQNIKNMFDENIEYTGVDDSFKAYISEISNGKVLVNNVFLQESSDESKFYTYTLSKNKQDYGSGDGIVTEIIEAINNGDINNNFGSVKYDNKNSGILDNLMIVIQGEGTGEEASGDILVNHKADYGGDEKINNLYVGTYVILNSESLVSDDAQSTYSTSCAGVISHEFLHTLGYPDLYRTVNSGKPVAIWDIMGSVSYMKQYPLSYLRVKQGWVLSNKITKSGTYTLNAVSESDDNILYTINTPLSDSETICLEYRKKQDTYGETDYGLTSSGLLVYRINDSVENLTNVAGKNYIYVFRPDVTDPEEAMDATYTLNNTLVNNVYNATINPDANETEYGSIDLTKEYTDNTIYYSDGRNTGIKISNVVFSSDKNSITFDIDFADYDKEDLWSDLGTVSNDVYESNNLYYGDTLYSSFLNTNYETVVKKYENNTWTQVGNSISNTYVPAKVFYYNNDLYLSTRSENNYLYNIDLYKLDKDSNTWTKLKTFDYNGEAEGSEFIINDSNNKAYIVCYSASKLDVISLEDYSIYATKLASYFSNPCLDFFNNELYIEYSDFFGTDKTGKLEKYSNNSWTVLKSYSSISNMNSITHDDNKLYAIFGYSSDVTVIPELNIIDKNSNLNTISINSITSNYINLSLNVYNDKAYVSVIDQTDNIAKTYVVKDNNEISLYNDNLGTNIVNSMVILNNGIFYATYSTENSNTYYVKSRSI